jgi:hypothetical protein
LDTDSEMDPEMDDFGRNQDTNMNMEVDAVSTSLDKESDPTIISICNPLMEVAGIRNPHQSNIFVDDSNAVQKPSWVRDSKCKYYRRNFQSI